MAKKIEFDLERVEELAYRGFKFKDTAQACGIAERTAYNNEQFVQAHKKGKARLRDALSEKILAKAIDMEDTTMQIFLAKRLGLFEKGTPKIELKSPEDALGAFAQLFNADLSTEERNSLRQILESFARIHENSEIEKRLMNLENQVQYYAPLKDKNS